MDRGTRVRRFMESFRKTFGESPENTRSNLWEVRRKQGLSDPTRAAQVGSNSQLGIAYRELASAYGLPGGFTDRMLMERAQAGLGMGGDPSIFKVRQEDLEGKLDFDQVGMGLNEREVVEAAERQLSQEAKAYKQSLREMPLDEKLGAVAGRTANDLNENRTRATYWLINAPQATVDLVGEVVAAGANPNLLTQRVIEGESLKRAQKKGLLKFVGGSPASGRRSSGGGPEPLPDFAARPRDMDDYGAELFEVDGRMAREDDLLNPGNYVSVDPSVKQLGEGDTRRFEQRRLNPNVQTAVGLLGSSLAVNSGIGLLSREPGYSASAPDELDPRETSNALFEVGSRYLLSREGNLLPKDDFLLERPDVTASEYAMYKGYQRDKETDLNPLDGDFNLGGVIKGTTDGIRGPEVSLFYKSLGLNDTIIPTAAAIGGVMLGGLTPNLRQLRLKGQRRSLKNSPPKGPMDKIYRAIPEVRQKSFDDNDLANPLIKPGSKVDDATKKLEDFFMETNEITGERDINVARHGLAMAAGATAGLIGGKAVGGALEDERRRRNFEKNYPGVDYDRYKANAQELLDQKYDIIKADPTSKDKPKSRRSRTSQQEALMTEALVQQSLVDEITDPIVKQRAQRELNKSFEALAQIQVLEGQKGQPYK